MAARHIPEPLSAEQAAAFRALLAADHEQTMQRLAALTEEFDGIVAAVDSANGDDEHDPEGATIAFERSQVSALIGQTRRHLVELDAAQGRLADGSYGCCDSCGQPIGVGRLEARPVARTCIGCAAEPGRR